MDRDREPVKTSLDAENTKESNERYKNIPLQLKFWKKIHICAFSALIFWQFSAKTKKLVPRIPFSFFDPVLRFADVWTTW